MKQALVLAGGPASVNGPKANNWKITRLFWEARDPNATVTLLKSTRAAGIGVGLMRDPSWNGLNAVDLARQLDADLTAHGFGSTTGPDSCAAMFDDEVHGNQYAVDMLTEWRRLRPTRTTLWTLESGQGGWMEPNLVALINQDPNLILVPQFYLGSPRLYPVDPSWAVDDLLKRGIDRGRIVGFYNGEKEVPYGWNGLIYDFNVLSAKPVIPL